MKLEASLNYFKKRMDMNIVRIAAAKWTKKLNNHILNL